MLLRVYKAIFALAVGLGFVHVALDVVDSTSTSSEKMSSHGPKPLVHVFNLYHHRGDANAFSPIGYEQWTMLASLHSSRLAFEEEEVASQDIGRQLAFDSVRIVCAVLDHEMAALEEVLYTYCDHVSTLTRSAATQYPKQSLRPMPFIQDIIDTGIAYADEHAGEYYLIYTNSDISATRGFYSWTESTLAEKGDSIHGMSINRLILDFDHLPFAKQVHDDQAHGGDTAELSLKSFAAKDVAARAIVEEARQVAENGLGGMHPGHDCFVYHSSIAKAFDYGDLFLGFSPLGNIRFVMTSLFPEEKFPVYLSHKHGTFHLGDERSWDGDNRPEVVATWMQNDPEGGEELANALFCPVLGAIMTNLHALQEFIECGKVFRPRRHESGRLVPNFVRLGYEQIFWDNYGHTEMTFSEDGLPNFEGKPVFPKDHTTRKGKTIMNWRKRELLPIWEHSGATIEGLSVWGLIYTLGGIVPPIYTDGDK